MRLFLFSAYFSSRSSYLLLSPTLYVAQMLVLPLAQIAFFSLIGAFGGGQPLQFYLVGNAMAIVATSSVFLAISISNDRRMGMLPYIVASPANRLALFLGQAAPRIGEALVHVLIAFAWVIVAFGLDLPLSTWPALALAILTAAVAVLGLGLLIGAVSYLVVDADILVNLMVFALLLLSGANVPLSELPSFARLLGGALPLTRSIAAARALAGGGGLTAALPLLLGDVIVGLAYAAVAYVLFNRFEAQARRRGTLEDA